jgi:hypothetical protein
MLRGNRKTASKKRKDKNKESPIRNEEDSSRKEVKIARIENCDRLCKDLREFLEFWVTQDKEGLNRFRESKSTENERDDSILEWALEYFGKDIQALKNEKIDLTRLFEFLVDSPFDKVETVRPFGSMLLLRNFDTLFEILEENQKYNNEMYLKDWATPILRKMEYSDVIPHPQDDPDSSKADSLGIPLDEILSIFADDFDAQISEKIRDEKYLSDSQNFEWLSLVAEAVQKDFSRMKADCKKAILDSQVNMKGLFKERAQYWTRFGGLEDEFEISGILSDPAKLEAHWISIFNSLLHIEEDQLMPNLTEKLNQISKIYDSISNASKPQTFPDKKLLGLHLTRTFQEWEIQQKSKKFNLSQISSIVSSYFTI